MAQVDKSVRRMIAQVVSQLRRTDQLDLLPELISEALEQNETQLEENVAVVESAIALTESQLQSLKKELEAKFGTELIMENQVNRSLIGGLTIRVGDTLIDQSLKSSIATVRERIAP